MFLIEDKVLMG